MDEDRVPLGEAASELRMPMTSVRRLVATGKLRAVEKGGRLYIARASLDNLKRRRQI